MTVDQWNLISNLSYCYGQHSGISLGECYMREQNVLPLKLRFKSASMMKYFLMSMEGTQSIYENNRDFLSLSSNDRSVLLYNTMKHMASLSTSCIYSQIGLLNHAAYYNTIGTVIHPNLVPAAKCIADRLDFDMIIRKLFLAILSFSTMNYTFYCNTPPINLLNVKQVLHIQNTYIELTWKYLLYKYNYKQTVLCFSNFIRCIFAVHDAVVKAQDLQWFIEGIDSLIQ
jgi:hypothetical protein